MVKKTVRDAGKMCVVEMHYESVRLAILLVIHSIDGDVIDKGIFASQMQMAAMNAVVQPALSKAIAD